MMLYRLVWMSSLLTLLCGSTVRADGGALQASEQSGKYRITVFTNPTPLRVGPADISVLIQDTTNRDAIATLPTEVTITPTDDSLGKLQAIATAAAATNKLFVAAKVHLHVAGKQQIEVICTDGGREHRVRFATNVEPALPHWRSLWPWYSWPIVVVAWMAVKSLWNKPRHAGIVHGRDNR